MTYDEALKELGDSVKENGDIYDLSWYADYSKGSSNITLDGTFDADSLEALAIYMRHHEA